MKVVEQFPFAFREIEHAWIPMRDGKRLSARLWLPETDAPVPAIVEYIPYRKRWGTRHRDEPMHRYFAGHGYACIRIDLRGSGESEGLLTDEYTQQEHEDGLDALAWIAEQSWCSGAVGMIGKSWGGFNALQIAALQPPQLKGVIAVCASDDRYADDAHYMGGCLLTENLVWGSVLFTLSALPPDPQIVPDWRKQWRERLDNLPLYAERWLKHPTRDDYWKRGSIAEHYGDIQCPVFLVSGWADGYSNAVPRMLAGLTCQRRGLIGPWAHVYPHEGVPGPAVGFLQEALAWFDHTLRGKDLPPAPMLRAWIQDYVAPEAASEHRSGRWVAEDSWPSPRIQARKLTLPAEGNTVSTPLSVGRKAGAWCGFGMEGDQPGDQREDDELSVCFDVPITEAFEILGAPVLRLRLACDKPFGQITARLCDVAPDGTSLRVSYGVLNLRHRDGHEEPADLQPGEVYDITLRLNDCGHAFAPGHTLRIALSTSYWPVVRPERESFTLTLQSPELELPERPPRDDDAKLPPMPPPERAPGAKFDDIEDNLILREQATEGATLVERHLIDVNEDGAPALARLEPIDLEIGHSIIEEFRVTEARPDSATLEVTQEAVTRRKGWETRVRTEHSLRSDGDHLVLKASVETWEHDIAVFSRFWEARIPRP